VWSYDFMVHRTHDGRAFRLLTIMDEFSRECLAIDVARQLKADDVLDRLTWLFAQPGAPAYLRSGKERESTAKAVREWLYTRARPRGVASATPKRLRQQSQFIEPGSPWENGYIESFNGKLRDELLDVEIFDTLFEAQVLVERWRKHYNTNSPHSSVGYRPPAPQARQPKHRIRTGSGSWRQVMMVADGLYLSRSGHGSSHPTSRCTLA